MQVDSSIVSALAALLGSVVGGSATTAHKAHWNRVACVKAAHDAAATVRAVASKILAGLGTFRRDELALARGLRVAAAVVLPLVIGGATGHIQHGAYMA